MEKKDLEFKWFKGKRVSILIPSAYLVRAKNVNKQNCIKNIKKVNEFKKKMLYFAMFGGDKFIFSIDKIQIL